MPPFVPLTDGAQVEVFFHFGGVTIENRLWFIDRSPPIVQAHLDALAAGVDSWYQGEILPWLSQDLTYVGVLAEKWDSAPGDLISAIHTSVPGGSSDKSYSANVAVRVRFKGDSSQTFPDNANFVPGIPDGAVDGNIVQAFFKTALSSGYADLIDLAAGFGGFPGWRWVITSRFVAGNWRTTQELARTDLISVPSPYVNPRRRRLPRPEPS